MAKTKTLIIGWDAADWQMIDPLMEEGLMPTLKQMSQQGVRGNLATLQPVLSPLLWTSIATGKPAYQHGVLGFVQGAANGKDVEPVRADKRQVKAFWNIFNEAGLNTQVVNWWPSFPVEKIKGAMVANTFCQWPEKQGDWPLPQGNVYPESLSPAVAELRMLPSELSLAHLQPFFPDLPIEEFANDELVGQAAAILAKCASVHNTITHLTETEDWDCAAVYYEALDHFGHLAMKFHPPKLAQVSQAEFDKYNYVMRAAYRFHDMMLQRLLELAGKDCNIILLSDHGFQSGALRTASLPDLPAAPALEHRSYGIFCGYGPAFKKATTIYGATLLDICPTLLHLNSLPIGQDMPGRVLQEALLSQRQQSYIPSWELSPGKMEFSLAAATENTAVLKQLEALGYIDLPENEKLVHINRDWEYNRALSLAHAGKNQEALAIARHLHQQDDGLRTTTLLADLLLKTNRIEEFESLLQSWPREVREHPYGLFLRGLSQLQTGATGPALLLFEKIAAKGIRSVSLMLEIASCLQSLGREAEAKNYADEILNLDKENPGALTIKAQALHAAKEYNLALELLEQTLQLRFYQPQAHYLMASCFYFLGDEATARKAVLEALRQAPRHGRARRLLQVINPEESTEKQEETIVVSGFPRSGTSMMMAVLQAGGIPLKIDQERTPDAHNPQGYFEYSPVKKLGSQKVELGATAGQALKVVGPLLPYLPADRNYAVIWLERPLLEVIISQEKMKGEKDAARLAKNFPFQLAVQYQEEEKRLHNWLDNQPNVRWQSFSYHDFVNQPAAGLKRLAGFLGLTLDEAAATSAVKPKLHRNKIG